MGKVLVFVLGAAILMGVAYYYVQSSSQMATESQGTAPSAPRQTLDNVHRAADRIEVQGQQNADKAAQETRE